MTGFADSIDDEDDVILVLAEELASLLPHLGGPEYAHTLIAPLETLSTVEETEVREKVP